jgi:hypothetical protein
MAHIRYYNNLASINEIVYESHMDLIKSICIELNQTDKIDQFQEKFLEKVKIKARRDPDKPKKSKTSYMYFCEETRGSIKETNPTLLLGDQSKLLGIAWSTCDCKEKYVKKASDDRERYEEEMEEYQMNSY